MSTVFRTLRAVRSAKLPTPAGLRTPGAAAQVARFSSRPVPAIKAANNAVKPSAMLRKLQRSFAAPIAKPHPFVKTTIQAGMPQLVPFYFINQVAFGFALLTTMVFLLSKYILPRMVRLFLSRTFITKL